MMVMIDVNAARVLAEDEAGHALSPVAYRHGDEVVFYEIDEDSDLGPLVVNLLTESVDGYGSVFFSWPLWVQNGEGEPV